MFKVYYVNQKKETCYAGEFKTLPLAIEEALGCIYDERMPRWVWVEKDGETLRKYYGHIN